jgi:hypothetical protein
MEKLDLTLIILLIIFVFTLGFVVNNLYFNDKDPSAKSNTSVDNPAKNTNNSSISLDASFDSCINQTKDNPQCKDCCDCLSNSTSSERTACRDTCALHDFSENSNIISITVPSILGKEGNYSQCVAKGSIECKNCCENEIGLSCGDYQYCRTACNNAFGDPKHNLTASTL